MPEVTWGQGRKELFTEYVCTDMNRALMDRSALESKWANWLDQYRAPTTTQVKSFPWVGASNITLPVTAMNADPLIARFVTIVMTPPNIWTLAPLNERWVNAAKPLQDYMQYLSRGTLNMYDVLYRSIIEFVKLGTCIYKNGWFFERRRTQGYLPDGTIGPVEKFDSKPFVDCVSLPDFLIPPEAYHIQPDQQGGARWVAERFYLTQSQFLARAQGQEPFLPDYDPKGVELVKNFVETARPTANPVEAEKYLMDDYIPSQLQRIELWECHARFDCTGDGAVDDVVAVVHLPSRTVLRTTCNPYRHGKRPYTVARYFRGDGFYGIGECEQSEVFQTLLTTLTNYQVDNVLAVNAPMLGVKLGANVVPNEPIYPLKIWPLDDPSKDIREIKLSDMNQSLPQLSGIVQSWCERRTGMTDIQQGDIQKLPSRTPATSMLSVLQEGNKRFDLSLKELRAALDEVGLRTLQNIQQFLSSPQQNPGAPMQLVMIVQTLGQPEGVEVARKLSMPLEDIENGLGVNITATSGSQNKELEKQAWLALAQLQAQMGGQYLQLAQIISNPQMQLLAPMVVETAAEVFKGTGEIHRRLLEQFDIRNPEDILVNTAVLLDHAAQSAPQTQALYVAGTAAGLLGGGGAAPEQAGNNGGVQDVPKAGGKAVPANR